MAGIVQQENPFLQKDPKAKLFPKKDDPTLQIAPMVQQLNSSLLRLRIIEEQSNQLRRRMQVTDQTTLRINKRLTEEAKLINTDLADIKITLDDLKEKVMLIISELRNAPKREEFQILKKYVELWEPMQFVSRKEVESIVEDALAKQAELNESSDNQK